MLEFEINGKTYRAAKMNALEQLKVAKRFAPVLGAMSGLFELLKHIDFENLDLEKTKVADIDFEQFKPVFKDFCLAIGELSDKSTEYIIDTCLAVVDIKQTGGAWARLRKNDITMFELELDELLRIVFQVLRHNLAGFSRALPSGLVEQGRTLIANG